MGSNQFGKLFTFTTFGESHGKAIGVVIDGCPSGVQISEESIYADLKRRRPGKKYSSPRKEKDKFEILSGVYQGRTLGTPICVVVVNRDINSAPYTKIYRPGHADFTYHKKYQHVDLRGGGRSSVRETVGRVIAGAIAKAFLKHIYQIEIVSTIQSLGGESNPKKWRTLLDTSIGRGDSVGGVIQTLVTGVPVGLGEPIYYKMEAMLANAMLSLPATKGFEIGEGFKAAFMKGSEHNDFFIKKEDSVVTQTNHSGGTLGGITTGMPLYFSVAFKPISTIRALQMTVDYNGNPQEFHGQKGGRHDPCPVVRAPVMVEAMTAVVLADAVLMSRLTSVAHKEEACVMC